MQLSLQRARSLPCRPVLTTLLSPLAPSLALLVLGFLMSLLGFAEADVRASCVKAGFVMMRERSGWKRRWLCIGSRFIAWFADDCSVCVDGPVGAVELQQATGLVSDLELSVGVIHRFVFAVSTTGEAGTLTLQASDERSFERWVAALNAVLTT